MDINRVKNGVTKYLDSEITPKLPGIKRWIFSAAVAAYLGEAENILAKYKDMEAVKMLGIIGDNNDIDIEKLYGYLRPAAEKCNATVDLPIVGSITFDVKDVDALYNYMR